MVVRQRIRNLTLIVVAAVLLGALAQQDTLLIVETRLTISVLCSIVVGSGLLVLCSTESTAPWMWRIVEDTAAGSLAFLWFDVYKARLAPCKRKHVFPVAELGCYALAYYTVCFALYVLRSNPQRHKDMVKPFSKLCGMFATEFGVALMSYALELTVPQALMLVVAEQFIFYAIWIAPRSAFPVVNNSKVVGLVRSGTKQLVRSATKKLDRMRTRSFDPTGPSRTVSQSFLPGNVKFLLPGLYEDGDELGDRTWQDNCDSIAISGCASTVLCFTGLSVLQGVCVGGSLGWSAPGPPAPPAPRVPGNPVPVTPLRAPHGYLQTHDFNCSINDRCAWKDDAHGAFWAKTTVSLLVLHASSALRLIGMRKRGGLAGASSADWLAGFAAFVFHGALAKAAAMAGLNYIRHMIFRHLCKWCWDGARLLFASLSVAYAASAIAMLEAAAMALFSQYLPESVRPAMHHVQNAIGLEVAAAWSKVFTSMASSKVMLGMLGAESQTILGLSLTALLLPVYVAYLRPAVLSVLHKESLKGLRRTKTA